MFDEKITEAVSSVVAWARNVTGDAEFWETHFGVDAANFSVYCVLQKDEQLKKASEDGICDEIIRRTVVALEALSLDFSTMSRDAFRFATQEYCNKFDGGNWHQ